MSLNWRIPPPPRVKTAEQLHGWLQMHWQQSRGLWSHILEPGCGLYYDTADDLAVQVDGTTITCGAAGLVASGAVLKADIDAKGDLIVGTANDTYDNLPVGTDKYVLTSDSAAGTGVAWTSPLVTYTHCFASNTAVAVNAASVGHIDRISTNCTLICPADKRLYILGFVGSARTGAAVGTTNVEFYVTNKTTAVRTLLGTATGTANTTIGVGEDYTVDTAIEAATDGEGWYLEVFNKADSIGALAAGPHIFYLVAFYI